MTAIHMMKLNHWHLIQSEVLMRIFETGQLKTMSNANRLTENTPRELSDKSEYLSNPS